MNIPILSSILAKAMRPQRPSMGMSTGLGIGIGHSTPSGQLGQLQALATVPWLFATIDRIATSIAAVQWDLFRVLPDGQRDIVGNHPALTMWRLVNPYHTREEFLETSTQHFELTGEMWWIIVRSQLGFPLELWPVSPHHMRPVPDPDTYIKGYIYSVGAMRIPLAPEDVIFIRRPHPIDPYRGIGTVQSLMWDLDAERSAAQWNRNFFRNSAEPGGIIQFDETLSQAEWETLTARWNEQHKGVANAHRVAVLERGTWVDRKLTQRDMQFESSRRLNRDIILGAFGMPGHLLGISETVNRANAEAGEVMFSRWIIKPRLQRIKAVINERLLPMFGETDLEFDYEDPTPANREQNTAEAVSGYGAGILTLNEARHRLSEPPRDDGDVLKPLPASPFAIPINGQGYAMSLSSPQAKAFGASVPKYASHEIAMARSWLSRLEREADLLVQFLDQFKSVSVSVPMSKIELYDVAGYDWNWWTKYGDSVIEELTTAFISFLLSGEVPLDQDVIIRDRAAAYARYRGSQLLRLDGDINIVQFTRTRVNLLVERTISTGASLKSLQKAISEDVAFSPSRAAMVARTETATALGQGHKEYALMQKLDQKRWYTQGDELVDIPLCRLNEAQGWIAIGDKFASGHDTIPAHPNCRCTVLFRLGSLHEGLLSGNGSHRLVSFRCPDCNKLIEKAVIPGSYLYCARCKRAHLVVG